MPGVSAALHASIAAVCPPPALQGVAIGSLLDKSTWRIDFGPGATPAQIAAAQAALQAFDPNGPQATAQSTFDAAIGAGATLTWSVSTALNDTYSIDESTQIRMLMERLSVAVNGTFTNGTTTLTWYSINGTVHTLTMAQAAAFAKAVWRYLTALFVARATAARGDPPAWPSPNVAITG